MVNQPTPRPPARHRWHERVEHYTPNGAIGRLLVAIPTGPIGVLLLIWGVALPFASGLLWLPVALVLVGVGLGATVLSVLMLWPVYLSLIGNVESARAYPKTDSTPELEEPEDDSIAVVKREYAVGNISETEFERRLETLLDAGGRSGVPAETADRRSPTHETVRETN